MFDLAGRSEVDVDVPARRRGGLIDILDDRGRLGGTGGRGHQIVRWVLDHPQPESARMVAGERKVNQKSLICPHSAASSCP